jgi:hypothetical protein
MKFYIISALQCGANIVIPFLTFLGGIWLLLLHEPNKKWITYLLLGFLIALVGFEATFLGLLLDPDTQDNSITSITKEAGKIGFFAFFVGLIFFPINTWVGKWSYKLFKPQRWISRKDGKYGKREF